MNGPAAAMPPACSPGQRRDWPLAALLVGLTLIVYGRAVRFDFLNMDDPAYVIENARVLDGLSPSGFRWAFTTFHDGNWIPLTWLSLMLDATFFGPWAGGYHLTNVVLHAANVLVLFATFRRMTGKPLESAVVAALLAVHPLHVQSVAWIAERKDVLSMLFGLSSLFWYARYAQARQMAALAAALVLFFLSLLAKQTLVTLPCVFLLLDFWPLGRRAEGSGARRTGAKFAAGLVAEKVPFFAASAVFCIVAVVAQSKSLAVRPLAEFPLSIRVLNALISYGLYLWKAFIPVGLAVFYPHPALMTSPTEAALSAAILSAISVLAIVNWRRRPFLLVGWFWFLGTLVPMIGLVQIGGQQMADRYAYFPLIGLYVASVWLVASLVPAAVGRRVFPAIAAVVIGVYAAIAFVEVGYWRDGLSLFGHAVNVTPGNPTASKMLLRATYFYRSKDR